MNARRAFETAFRVGTYAAFGAAGSALAWVAVSSLAIDHRRRLRPALDAPLNRFSGSAGELSYYADKSVDGRPLLLIHSVNAAASAIEMKPLFERYRATRPVYAFDLPGFGFSSREDRSYNAELYTQAIVEMIDREISGEHPVDIVALSLSSEFAALAAIASPHSIRSLTLISPTGFGPQSRPHLSLPVASQAFYDLVTSRPSLRYYLNKSFCSKVPSELVDYAYETSHQPGAKYAPLAFLNGTPFTEDIRSRYYGALQVPVLALYDRDPYVTFEELEPFVRNHMNWVAVRIPETCGLPHWEKMTDTAAAIEYFWKDTVPVIGAAMGRDTERTSACATVKSV